MHQTVYSHTQAICPQCMQKVTARYIGRDQQVYLEKFCPEHGFSEVLASSDEEWYKESLYYVKPKQAPLDTPVSEFKGCPESCGTCTQHAQHTCLPVIEINRACNLQCPVCLKGEATQDQMSLEEFSTVLDTLFRCEGSVPVVNLSGGEPTVHPQIAELLRMSRKRGVLQTTVSTNGIPLIRNKELRNAFRETGSIVALQFDGFGPEPYLKLRGCDLFAQKMELINILNSEGISFSLVATIADGVNLDQVGKIADFLFESQAVSLMFQPMTKSGYASNGPLALTRRVTIPDIVNGFKDSKFAQPSHFTPLPCSHFSCFALSYFLQGEEGKWMSLKDFLGKERFLDVVANRTLPGLDSSSFGIFKERLYELWSAADSSDHSLSVLNRMRHTIRQMEKCSGCQSDLLALGMKSMKGIFIHHFMDAETMDLGRLMKCCNPYPRANGKLIPMCAANVFGG